MMNKTLPWQPEIDGTDKKPGSRCGCLVALFAALWLAADASAQLAASPRPVSADVTVLSSAEVPDPEKCPASLGTVRLQDDAARASGVETPLDALRRAIQNSNCLVIINGNGRAGGSIDEPSDASAQNGKSRDQKNIKGQTGGADFDLQLLLLKTQASVTTREVADSSQAVSLAGSGSSAPMAVQLTLLDMRSGVPLKAVESGASWRNTEPVSAVVQHAGAEVPSTPNEAIPTAMTAASVRQAFAEAYEKMVPALRNYRARTAPGVPGSSVSPTAPDVPGEPTDPISRGVSQVTMPSSIQTPPSRSPAQPGVMYPVWFGTNRRPRIASNESEGYSGDRDVTIHYGKAWVYIPKGHRFGSTGATWFARLFTTDDQLSLKEIVPAGRASFFGDIKTTLSRSRDGTLLIYIHGFDVTFQEATIRAAQIGFDLGVHGVVALYNWPSRGSFEAYAADEASVQAAEDSLVNFIIDAAHNSSARQIDIIAHSMGNLGLLRALNRTATQAELKGIRFGQIFLAAPDVDAELFGQLATIYPKISDRTTLYISSRDKALEASHWMRDFARAGFSPPITSVAGIDTIEVTNIDLTVLGHSYYAEAEDVLHDMFVLMQHNDPPDRRQRLVPAKTPDGAQYWTFSR